MIVCAAAFLLGACVAPDTLPPVGTDSAGFVTMLGRDTVALETVTRAPGKLEGDIIIRVPSTVHFHYAVALAADGSFTHSVLLIDPRGPSSVLRRTVTLDVDGDSVLVTADSAGHLTRIKEAAARNLAPLFTTGFGASYGLYGSIGMYELQVARALRSPGESAPILAIDPSTGRIARRRVTVRNAHLVDVDYFGMASTHLALSEDSRILEVDASETTEQTRSKRTSYFNAGPFGDSWADGERRGRTFGEASPDVGAQGVIGGAGIRVTYGSPRTRGRQVLGTVVPYDKIWRTGANAATVLLLDRDLLVGGRLVKAGAYSLWTLPTRQGVTLILNSEYGQWGTSYHQARDVSRVSMQSSSTAHVENFTIALKDGDRDGELRISWDDFTWSVPLAVP